MADNDNEQLLSESPDDLRSPSLVHSAGQRPSGFTFRAVASGLLAGVLINISNTYYGLRVGAGSQMSMVSALMGYAGFKLLSKSTWTPLTPPEHVLLVSVATATGCMPLTAGLIGAVPALEYLIGSEDNGPLHPGYWNLVLWSLGLAFFGIIFAALLREDFIEQGQLPWPGASATARLIKTLHRIPSEETLLNQGSSQHDLFSREHGTADLSGPETPLSPESHREPDWKAGMKRLLFGGITSCVLSVIVDRVPILHQLPVFGHEAARAWLWTFDLSPGFFGQGMIIGPFIALHMLMGAIVGWGVLSPYAKYRGCAPGPVDDWETGSRGWIIWISLASLLADAFVKLGLLVLAPVWKKHVAGGQLRDRVSALWSSGARERLSRPSGSGYGAIPSRASSASVTAAMQLSRSSPFDQRHTSKIDSLTAATLGWSFVATIIFCTLAVHVVFGNMIPWYYTPLSVALSLPMAAVGIRSIAETDYNPESAIISQLVFATIVSHANPNAIIINLISAAVAVAAANQSGDLAYDLKVGSIIGAHPEEQIFGQVIGSIFGVFLSCGIYRLYTMQYTIPGPLFRVPSAYLVLSTAKLLLGRGLPEGVWPFVVAAAALSVLATIVKTRYEKEWWQKLIPSGVSFAIGVYLLPSFSITRTLGGLCYGIYMYQRNGSQGNIITIASGLVLGESLASLLNIAIVALQAPGHGRH